MVNMEWINHGQHTVYRRAVVNTLMDLMFIGPCIIAIVDE